MQSTDPSAPIVGAPEPSRSGVARTEYHSYFKTTKQEEQWALEFLITMRNIQHGNHTKTTYNTYQDTFRQKLFILLLIRLQKENIFLLRRHYYVKISFSARDQKILATPVVNFINVFCAQFSYKILVPKISNPKYSFRMKFWRQKLAFVQKTRA